MKSMNDIFYGKVFQVTDKEEFSINSINANLPYQIGILQ